MEKYDYLRTKDGKRARLRYNALRRIVLSYPERLISRKKGANSLNDEVIAETIKQMEQVNRFSFKAEIACNITINAERKNLPETYHISKNFLDLLNRKWIVNNNSLSKLHRIPFNDDSQISYLSISFNGLRQQGLGIHLSNFGRFLNDLALAFSLRNVDRNDDFDNGPDWDWQVAYWQANEIRLRKQFGDQQYEESLTLSKKLKQDSFWSGNKLAVSEIYNILGYKGDINKHSYHNLSIGNPLEKTHRTCAAVCLRSIISSPYSVSLPDPCCSGFSAKANAQLKAFKSNILNNKDFDIPVGIQILYRPFNERPKKDLDNISREVLQCFKGLFKNPSYDMFTLLPESYKNSTACYEALRLPYEKGSKGFLILRIFSLYMNTRPSLWDEITSASFSD